MPDLRRARRWRRSLHDFLKRKGIDSSRIRCPAAGNPGLVRQCDVRGGNGTPDTADRVRVLIGALPLRRQVCQGTDALMALTG